MQIRRQVCVDLFEKLAQLCRDTIKFHVLLALFDVIDALRAHDEDRYLCLGVAVGVYYALFNHVKDAFVAIVELLDNSLPVGVNVSGKTSDFFLIKIFAIFSELLLRLE